MIIQSFARNTVGRDFIVGDIHGAFSKLWQQLTEDRSDGSFDVNRDRLFCVGDLVDRGPESHQAQLWLSYPWFHSVRGNHEDMAIRWAARGGATIDMPLFGMDESNYAYNGGKWMIDLPKDLQAFHGAALDASTPYVIELETSRGMVGIVHAECPYDSWADMKEQLTDPTLPSNRVKAAKSSLLWSRDRIQEGVDTLVDGIGAVVCGHTPVKVPTRLGNHLFIETVGWRERGRFTILNAEDVIR